MSTFEDLKNVVKENLEQRGVLGEIKARVRAEVFNALDDQTAKPPELSNENLLINELIREYLEFNQYKNAAAVLQTESGQPKIPLDREFLSTELSILEDAQTRKVPLLYGIVGHFLSRNSTAKTRTKLQDGGAK